MVRTLEDLIARACQLIELYSTFLVKKADTSVLDICPRSHVLRDALLW